MFPLIAVFEIPLLLLVALPLLIAGGVGFGVAMGRLLTRFERRQARDAVVVQPAPASWNAGVLACAHRRCDEINAARTRIAKERERLLIDDALLAVEHERLTDTFDALGGARRRSGGRRPSSSSPPAGSGARVLYLARARSHCSGRAGLPGEEGDGGYTTARPAPPPFRRPGARSEPPGA